MRNNKKGKGVSAAGREPWLPAVLRNVLDNMKEGVSLMDAREPAFIYTNPAFNRMLGFAPGELDGKPLSCLPSPVGTAWKARFKAIGDLLEKTGFCEGTTETPCAGGRVIYTSVVRSKLQLPSGPAYLSIHQDTTACSEAQKKARENEIIFSSFLKHSPVYVFFKDKEIRSVRLSDNYRDMLGMPAEKALGKTMDELFPSPLSRSMMEDDRRVLKDRKVITVTETLAGHTYETTKFPIYMDGRPHMLAGITIDITERKSAEEALKAATAELAAQKAELERKNNALREVLSQLEVERVRLRRDLSEGLEEVLEPFFARMKTCKDMGKYAVQVQRRIRELVSPLRPPAVVERMRRLTLREREICEMVRGGMSTKEISALVKLSSQTVDAHRRSIRRKLGLTNKEGGLAAFLQRRS